MRLTLGAPRWVVSISRTRPPSQEPIRGAAANSTRTTPQSAEEFARSWVCEARHQVGGLAYAHHHQQAQLTQAGWWGR